MCNRKIKLIMNRLIDKSWKEFYLEIVIHTQSQDLITVASMVAKKSKDWDERGHTIQRKENNPGSFTGKVI
jgi:hypothetical protein